MNTPKKILFIYLSLLLSLCILAGSALAIGVGGLGIRPHPEDGEPRDWFVYASWPGTVIEDKVDIFNTSDEPIGVKIYPVDALILADGAFAPKAEDAERTNIGAWTRLTASELTLSPHETRTVDFTLTIPENTEPGRYTGAIIVHSKEAREVEPQEGIVMRLVIRIGARVYLTVRGTRVQFLEIRDINLGEELRLQATIWNYEEDEISTRVEFDLFDDQGTLLESWVSPEEPLGPDDSRAVQFSKDTAEIGMGDYLVVGRVYRNGEEFRRFEAEFKVGWLEFVLSALAVTPDRVLVGEEATISVNVENIGNIEGTYTVTLIINDIVEATEEVTIAPGETKTVTFTVSRTEAGTYNVVIDELTGIFTVRTPIPWTVILIGVAIALLLAILLAGVFLLRKRFHFKIERKEEIEEIEEEK
ncbi:DUF916 domain-containing protein [Dehalococcoidia bacterium]|nr:DUF916 domain-containing protein [Dehalococcoidia bacterium]MCL0073728.1 DUF916 domain-containing protein [Dehalococcoidia bacterium]